MREKKIALKNKTSQENVNVESGARRFSSAMSRMWSEEKDEQAKQSIEVEHPTIHNSHKMNTLEKSGRNCELKSEKHHVSTLLWIPSGLTTLILLMFIVDEFSMVAFVIAHWQSSLLILYFSRIYVYIFFKTAKKREKYQHTQNSRLSK